GLVQFLALPEPVGRRECFKPERQDGITCTSSDFCHERIVSRFLSWLVYIGYGLLRRRGARQMLYRQILDSRRLPVITWLNMTSRPPRSPTYWKPCCTRRTWRRPVRFLKRCWDC